MAKFMHRKIAAACSVATLALAGASVAVAAQDGPTSSITQSSAPASSTQSSAPAARTQPAAPTASPTQGVTPPAAAGATDISDAKLQQFVSSAQQVAVLSNEYTTKLQSVQDDASKQEIVQEANEKMAAAVESNGLTVNEFNRIGEAVEGDPALAQRAQQMLR